MKKNKIMKKLEKGTIETLEAMGAKNIKVFWIDDSSLIIAFEYENEKYSIMSVL